jgi:hypothetical protein
MYDTSHSAASHAYKDMFMSECCRAELVIMWPPKPYLAAGIAPCLSRFVEIDTGTGQVTTAPTATSVRDNLYTLARDMRSRRAIAVGPSPSTNKAATSRALIVPGLPLYTPRSFAFSIPSRCRSRRISFSSVLTAPPYSAILDRQGRVNQEVDGARTPHQ